MKRRNEAVYSTIEQGAFILILLLFVLFSIVSAEYEKNTDSAMLGDINEGWVDEYGHTVDLYDLAPGRHTVTLDISALNTDGKAICFNAIDTRFKVYASDELIYDYNPVIPRHLGISYGMQYHTIAIPEGSASLKLYIEPVFKNTPAGIEEITISDEGQYMTKVFKRNSPSFGQGAATIFIGILFVIAGFTGQIVMKSTGIDFISFGITCVMIGYIGFNDTHLLQILTGRPDIIRVTEYMCVVFIPFPALSFFASTTGESHTKLLSGMFVLCLLNFFLQVGLTTSGVSDYYYLVYISQVIVLIGFLTAVGIVYRAIRRGKNGYPNGLSGDEIPQVARIIAVADTFDAMYSDRQYRKRLDFDEAISRIREASGTQLNPEVVDAFFRLVDKGEIKA